LRLCDRRQGATDEFPDPPTGSDGAF
jgi:hypothetical protein